MLADVGGGGGGGTAGRLIPTLPNQIKRESGIQ